MFIVYNYKYYSNNNYTNFITMKNWIMRVFGKIFNKRSSSLESQNNQKQNYKSLDENYKFLMDDFEIRKSKSEGGSASSSI